MLKIKDNVDLDNLKKYGFGYEYKIVDDEGKTEIFGIKMIEPKFIRMKFKKRKHIMFFRKKENFILDKNNLKLFNEYDIDLLYDLIQAGLVEKVEGSGE